MDGKIHIGKFFHTKAPSKQKKINENNYILQKTKDIVSYSVPDSFVLNKTQNYDIRNYDNEMQLLIKDFFNFQTEFIPDIPRTKAPIKKITADTHCTNISRFFGFFRLHKEQLFQFAVIKSSSYVQNAYNFILIRFYFQVLLNRGNSGQYLRLIIRSFFNFLYFIKIKFKDLLCNDDIQSCLEHLKTLNISIQHAYVYYDSKKNLQDYNSWMEFEEFQVVCKKFHQNFIKWATLLSPNSVPHSISTFVTQSYWKKTFYLHLSRLQQLTVISSLLSCIPTPRTSNIRNLCLFFRKNEIDKDLTLLYMQHNISSVLEIRGFEYIDKYNNYLQFIFNQANENNQIDYFQSFKSTTSTIYFNKEKFNIDGDFNSNTKFV